MAKKIKVFDTTLRDGEQVPGAKLERRQKLEIAKQLEKLGVDIIEAGFPISSPEDGRAVADVAREITECQVAGLARAAKQDIDACWEAVRHARNPRIHVFLGSSDIHVEKKLRTDKEHALNMAVEMVKYAKSLCENVEYSTEDASRSDEEYLVKIIDAVIRAGATTVNIPDTVGYAVPEQFGALVKRLKERVPGLDNVNLSVHCHNDLGMAVANTLAAIQNGADQVECTINGIGERAGNASLEEIVMALKVRREFFDVDTGVNTPEIYRTSRMVSRLMNIPVQPNKAVVGSNAFAHSSGVHQDGILKDRRTYEIMQPEDIGLTRHEIILTARSGKSAVKHKLSELGFNLTDEQFKKVMARFINVADRKKEVNADDLRSIVEIEMSKVEETFTFSSMQVMSGDVTSPLASVELIKKDGTRVRDAALGNGPVDATFACIERLMGKTGKLLDFDLKAVTGGKEALGEAWVRVEINGEVYSGVGASPDIIESSARAYINAFNRYFMAKQK